MAPCCATLASGASVRAARPRLLGPHVLKSADLPSQAPADRVVVPSPCTALRRRTVHLPPAAPPPTR
eukprot:2781728-Prymnesium_polylepis.1